MRLQTASRRGSITAILALICFGVLAQLTLNYINNNGRNNSWLRGLSLDQSVNAQTQGGNAQNNVTTIDVSLPSESTGVAGGTLAVRIFSPASRSVMRHTEGAPVLVHAPGSDTAGSLEAPVAQASSVIRIAFLYPGGRDLTTQRSSSGSYDYRGERSIAAMRDVVLFAAGQLTDSNGRRIDEVVPVPVQKSNIGLFGSSNGGNMVVAVLASHGIQLAPYVKYVIQWESPVLSQVATVDAGPTRLICSNNRRDSLASGNPWYRPKGNSLTELAIDYSRIRYSPTSSSAPVFFDGNGDGRYTTIADPARPGCQTPDLNGDGQISTLEDRPLGAYGSASGKQYYSRQATAELAASGTVKSWPTTIATPAEAATFWDLREAVRLYDEAVGQVPQLEAMVLTGFTDHVQTTMTENAHVRMAFENLNNLGVWVRINPGRQSAIGVDPRLSTRSDLPETPANTAPADWTARSTYTYPDNAEATYWAAAVYEMADRARAAARTSVPATLTVNPATVSFESAAGSSPLTIESNGAWTAQELLDWVTLSKSSGNGNDTVNVSVTASQSLQDRSGAITFSSGNITRLVNVSQKRFEPALTVSASTLSLAATGGTQSLTISSNTAWSVSDNADFVTVTPESGTGNGSLTVTCQPNIQTQSRSALITLTASGVAPLAISLTQSGSTSGSTTISDFGIFSINVQDFSYPEKSIATVNRILDIHEKHNIPVDIYLTTTMIDLFEQLSPQLVQRLKTSSVASVSYHVRPPKPYYTKFDWAGLGTKSTTEQFSTILNYETHGLDLTTGMPTAASGGYQKLKDVLGYAPWAATAQADGGLAQQAALVFKSLGSRFRVNHGSASNLGDKRDGIYIRPEHHDLLLFQTVGQDVRTVVENGITQAHQAAGAKAPYFVGIKMHDNDFFAVDSAWVTVYVNSPRRPPFNTSKKSALLSDSEQQAVWKHYESTVSYVASQRSRFTAVGLPGVWEMLNPSGDPTTDEVSTTVSQVYVSGTMHIETNRLRWPNVDTLLAFFTRATKAGKVGSQTTAMKWSVGADIGWLTGEPRAAEVIAKLEAMGVEMDIHAHNFSDRANCAAQITKLGGHPNKVSSGNTVTEIDALRSPVTGSNGATWQASILYGTNLSPGHAIGADDKSYGVWRPKSGSEYTVHDPAGNLISVGGGLRTLDGATAIIDQLKSARGLLPVYSATVMVHPDTLVVVGTSDGIDKIEAWAAAAGNQSVVKWATLTETAAAWVAAGGKASRVVDVSTLSATPVASAVPTQTGSTNN